METKVPASTRPLHPIGCINSHFLDSGAFTLWTKAREYHHANCCTNDRTCKRRWDYYSTDDFWAYVDAYADFVKTYHAAIDLYANIDVIPNPKLSLRNLRYLEQQHGLRPVPVVHFRTDLKWLDYYIRQGYEIIGLGGLVGSLDLKECKGWIDRCFDFVCNTSNRMPMVKIHGFGITTFEMMVRYPWYSLDSTSWTKAGAYGNLYVPRMKDGKFVFDTLGKQRRPYIIKVSYEAYVNKLSSRQAKYVQEGKKKRPKPFTGAHIERMSEGEKEVVDRWLKSIGFKWGKYDKATDTIIERGVTTSHSERRAANLMFFEEFRWHAKLYPWPWRGGGVPRTLFDTPIQRDAQAHVADGSKQPLTIYYSGSGSFDSIPETVIGEDANVMLTYFTSKKSGKPETRFREIHKARVKRNKKQQKGAKK